jgi:dGTPase
MSVRPPDLRREHPDPLAEVDAPLLVDRQRIVHSAAFRRLEYKTQVFVALEGDHYRTRMTHTLEVANLARRLARALGHDADLAEVVALAHDLGHPPFGHAGERALDECLRSAGGFEHNLHSLRVVDYLEHPYPLFRGLNLTRAVRECLAKHSTQFDKPGPHPLQDGRPPPPEGHVAALADRLAYGLHDLQDGLYAGLIEPSQLDDVGLWRAAYEGPAAGDGPAWRRHLRPTVERMQHALVTDVLAFARDAGRVGLSPAVDASMRELEAFLLHHLYRHHRLVRMDTKARRIVSAVFEAYVAEPALLPRRYAERVAEQGAERVAADYVAGMTDRFCADEHARLFDPRVAP